MWQHHRKCSEILCGERAFGNRRAYWGSIEVWIEPWTQIINLEITEISPRANDEIFRLRENVKFHIVRQATQFGKMPKGKCFCPIVKLNLFRPVIFSSDFYNLFALLVHAFLLWQDFFVCVYRDINQVNLAKELGLVIFCWGDDNNCKDTIKYLKEKGLHAIIYDKVDLLIDDSKVNLDLSLDLVWVYFTSSRMHIHVSWNDLGYPVPLITTFLISGPQLDKASKLPFSLVSFEWLQKFACCKICNSWACLLQQESFDCIKTKIQNYLSS